MLYYATVILLHRPFNSTPVHHLECRNASHCLEQLIVCLENTFGLTRLTYLIAYCVYTGASVVVPDVNAGDLGASAKMQTFLRALQGGVETCPIVQRSIDIINSNLTPQMQNLDTFSSTGTDNAEQAAGRYLPAFPVPQSEINFDIDWSAENLDMDSFSLLNCFPEFTTTSLDPELYTG